MPETKHPKQPDNKILNKTFYQFVFSFIGVIATVLLIILALGVIGVQ